MVAYAKVHTSSTAHLTLEAIIGSLSLAVIEDVAFTGPPSVLLVRLPVLVIAAAASAGPANKLPQATTLV